MREWLSAVDIANSIRMTRSQYSGSFLVVEGRGTDLKIFRRLVDRTHCNIQPAHGRDNVLDVIKILEEDKFGGIVGLVDADFWHVEGLPPLGTNIVVCEYHDLEILLLTTRALEVTLVELGSEEKIERLLATRGTSVEEFLLQLASTLGFLRLLSIRNGYNLKFSSLKFTRFLNVDSMEIDVAQMIQHVIAVSQRQDLSVKEIENEIASLANAEYDLRQICCGHDVIAILAVGLRKVVGTKDANEARIEIIESVLRAGFGPEDFAGTSIYKDLRAWEAGNVPYTVLPSAPDAQKANRAA
jgi:hypothetical protein